MTRSQLRFWREQDAAIRAAMTACAPLIPPERIARARAWRGRIAAGTPVLAALPELFALLAGAARDCLGYAPHPVQLQGATLLTGRTVVEMRTGEGKTLTAAFPLALFGQLGQGVWLVTANDYLARRDADLLRPLYAQLGLTVGAVTSEMSPLDRRESYHCDITYGTAREFGFDFLRDRLRLRDELGSADADPPPSVAARLLQRPPAYVLVDEADSVLIDEARTPLILSGPSAGNPDGDEAAFRWAAKSAPLFQPDRDYIAADPARPDSGPVWLTAGGRERARTLPLPPALDSFRLPELYEFIERAIRVNRDFLRDRQYVVLDGAVVLVDEQTGRPGFGRQWPEGLHQAVEAREGLALTPQVETLARTTLQDFFARFPLLAGLTGTAVPAARELRSAYRLDVVPLPTHHPCRREERPPRLFATRAQKREAVLSRVVEVQATGRPVLVGTRTIDESRRLSEGLTARGVAHRVLNATQLADEAAIVAEAGQAGQVTIATNMAGRGTDIALGPGVAERGGLYVIGTELHDSARVDAQLAGRCARQGDPGTVEQFAAVEDPVVATAWGPRTAARLLTRAIRAAENDGSLRDAAGWYRLLQRAQQRVEAQQTRDRGRLREAESTRRERARTLGQSIYAE